MKKTCTNPPDAITTPDYWEKAWAESDIPLAIDPSDLAPENYFYRMLHDLFTRHLGAHCQPGAKLIEIGCGGSRWLPYFHKSFGYEVSGIDYTEAGLELAQSILEKANVDGQLVHGDLFKIPPEWRERFDVVVSFGLVEHFENTSQVISACSGYLRPGGQMITLVPTMRGLYGLAYRMLRPSVYRKHVPHSLETLKKAHADAGLNIRYCGYILGLPGLLSAKGNSGLLSRMTFALSRSYWSLERSGFGVPPNRFTSPYALCILNKPL